MKNKTTKNLPSLIDLGVNCEGIMMNALEINGVKLHKENFKNFKQWSKKPFTGWVVGAKYNENADYKILLIMDCLSLYHNHIIDFYIGHIRKQAVNDLKRELNRPVQKIAAKKMARK